MAVSAVEIQKDDQYVLNHCTRFLARDDDAARHDFGQYEPADPRARTQRGNNNACCQANAISWYDSTPDPAADELTAFTRHAIAVQRAHATLRRRDFLRGDGDATWLDATGAPMSDAPRTVPVAAAPR